MKANEIKCRRSYTLAATPMAPAEVVRVIGKVEIPNWKRPGSQTWFRIRFADGGRMCAHPSNFTGEAA